MPIYSEDDITISDEVTETFKRLRSHEDDITISDEVTYIITKA